MLGLSDGGAPGNEVAPEFPFTRDGFSISFGVGRIHQYGWLRAGNITIRRY